MAQVYAAEANPEKSLFVYLITRDIGLADAIVDLTDNSVNAALKPLDNALSDEKDFRRLLERTDPPKVTIRVSFNENQVSVEDDAAGINFAAAEKEIFRFGHTKEYDEQRDRLSVYGIGMKRAIFKIGDVIHMTSDSKSGGFDLNFHVSDWASDSTPPWTFPITKRDPSDRTGTSIVISNLHPDIRSRISDSRFETELIQKLSKVYSFFLGRVVNIFVNKKEVPRTDFQVGENYSRTEFAVGPVFCAVLAGIAPTLGLSFPASASGWFVFCNYRTVLYADKTELTGWGVDLPTYQPKHRPFIGVVWFTSADPEALPWTTTKSSVNPDSMVWQEARSKMEETARPIIRLLDSRYSDQGTLLDPKQVADVSAKPASVFASTVTTPRTFFTPAVKTDRTIKIQYHKPRAEVARIQKHLGRSGMSGSEVGRVTFDYFLKNVVGGK
jgi:hypothetical protein